MSNQKYNIEFKKQAVSFSHSLLSLAKALGCRVEDLIEIV